MLTWFPLTIVRKRHRSTKLNRTTWCASEKWNDESNRNKLFVFFFLVCCFNGDGIVWMGLVYGGQMRRAQIFFWPQPLRAWTAPIGWSEREFYAIFAVDVLRTLLFGTCKTLVISFHMISLPLSVCFCVVFSRHYGSRVIIQVGFRSVQNLWRHQQMLMFYTSNVHISICSERWPISLLPPSLYILSREAHT